MTTLSKPQYSNLYGEWIYFWNDIEVRGGFDTALEARQDQLERLRELDRIESEAA